jgi:hypothetical protein
MTVRHTVSLNAIRGELTETDKRFQRRPDMKWVLIPHQLLLMNGMPRRDPADCREDVE